MLQTCDWSVARPQRFTCEVMAQPRVVSVAFTKHVSITSPSRPVGELLRAWRERRRLTQLELALQAEVSTRHLSFLETGRSSPSREMILHLADQLEVPLRERNQLLLAAGFAPM